MNTVDLRPIGLRDFKLLPLIVEAQKAGWCHGVNGSLCHADGAGLPLLDELLARHKVCVTAKQNVGAATRHICGNGDHAETSGLRNNLRFALVELRIQHDMAHAFALQDIRKTLRFLNGSSTDQNRLARFIQLSDAVRDCIVLFFLRSINDIRILNTKHRLICGDDHDFKLVDLFELGSFSFCSAGHTTELLVEAEVVLKGNSGKGLVFLADVDAFFGLNGLMQTVTPAAPRHQAASEGIDDDNFAVLNHVFHVTAIKRIRLDG